MNKFKAFWFSFVLMAAATTGSAQTLIDCPAPPPSIPGGPPISNPFPSGTTCYSGADVLGANYFIAIPPGWNGTLYLFPHGGPDSASAGSKPVVPGTIAGTIAAIVPKGNAFAATNYSRQGWAFGSNAEDIENLRRIFVKKFGSPKRTLLFGGSYAGGVISRVMEKYGVNPDHTKNYDGALIHCGLLGGLQRYFDFFVDQRLVYQHYCKNYPLPSEEQFPLYLGFPLGVTAPTGPNDPTQIVSPVDLLNRVTACTGYGMPDDQRTPQQKQNRDNILKVLRMPVEMPLPNNLGISSKGLSDLSQALFGGNNAIPNTGVVYTGSSDDAALNRGIPRYPANSAAFNWLAADSNPMGNINAPILTMHDIHDDIVLVEHESAYLDATQRQHKQDLLFQTFVDDAAGGPAGHCAFTPAEFQTSLDAFSKWLDTGTKPTIADVQSLCQKNLAASADPTKDMCRFSPGYKPQPIDKRVYPRNGPGGGPGDEVGQGPQDEGPRH